MIRTQRSKGFTLLEIILVLVIIGFFAAMIAPKLAGISDTAGTKIDASTKGDIVKFTRVWQQEHAGLPNEMVNLLIEDENGLLIIPEVDDVDSDNGEETLSQDFITRVRPYLHTLNDAEAQELRKLGVKFVMTLNDAEGSDTSLGDSSTAKPMWRTPVARGLRVLMVGGGANDDTDTPAWTQGVSDAFSTYSTQTGVTVVPNANGLGGAEDHTNPEWMYRIVLGIGPDCSLVTDGTVASAALSPATTSKATYKYYCMILPRLKATVNRISSAPTKLTVVGDSGEQKDITINLPQEQWDFGVVGPDGKIWPAATNDMWDIRAIIP